MNVESGKSDYRRTGIERTCDNQIAQSQQLNSSDITATSNDPTFEECIDEADQIAMDAGIDIDEHLFCDMNVEMFENARNANSRNNIGLHWQRRQDASTYL
jgi:hypothetical protein